MHDFSPRLGPIPHADFPAHVRSQSEVVSSRSVPKIPIDLNLRSPTDELTSNKFTFRNALGKNISPSGLRHNTFGDVSDSARRGVGSNSDKFNHPEYSFQGQVSTRRDFQSIKNPLGTDSKRSNKKGEDPFGNPSYHLSKISDMTQGKTGDENNMPPRFKRMFPQIAKGSHGNMAMDPQELKKSPINKPQSGKGFRRWNITDNILAQVDESRKITVPESSGYVLDHGPSYEVMHTSEFGNLETETDNQSLSKSVIHPPTRESNVGIFNLTKTPFDVMGEYRKLLSNSNLHVVDNILSKEKSKSRKKEMREYHNRSLDYDVHKRLKTLEQIVNFTKLHQNQFRLGNIAPPGARLDQDLHHTNTKINIGKMEAPEDINMIKAITIQNRIKAREKSREQSSRQTKHRVSFKVPGGVTQAEENLRKNFRFNSSIIKPIINPVRVMPSRDKRTLNMSPFVYKVYQIPRDTSLEKYHMSDPAGEMGSPYHNVKSMNARKKSSSMVIVTPDRSFEQGIIFEEGEGSQHSQSQLY